jgi:hypothetical protein
MSDTIHCDGIENNSRAGHAVVGEEEPEAEDLETVSNGRNEQIA